MSCQKLPLVSVIIPIFNAKSFLKETLESVLQQTYANIEVIMIDDGSTDGSYELALDYQAKNVIVNKNVGKGACAARNYGFELSSGSYIQYLDADDLLGKTKIENQILALINQDKDIAVCNALHFYDSKKDSTISDKDFIYSTRDSMSFLINLLGGNGDPHFVAVHAWLTPRSLIEAVGLWDETLLKDQDGEFFCRVALASTGIVYVPMCICYYRKHTTGINISALNGKVHLDSQLRALESKERHLLQRTNSELFRRAMALQYKWLAVNAWPQHKKVSRKAFQKSKNYGGSNYMPILGGSAVEYIKTILGWRTAKYLSYYGHKIF